MHHSVAFWQILHNRPKIHNAGYLSFVDFSYFWFTRELLDGFKSLLCPFCISTGDHDQTVIVDIDRLHACISNDAIDGLSTGTDDVSDKLWVDAQSDNTWSVGREVGSRFSDGCGHDIKNLHAGFPRLGKCLLHHVWCKTSGFRIHLDGGDA